ncbi:MAG: ATP-binding protein [Sulfurimonas sp.]|nr:ATP-binding protein [Sulfurimonas sp.]
MFIWQRDKNISFDIEQNSRVPKVMISDKTKLFQILTNLVSNALKFTAEGGVRLTLNADENKIFFKVIDTGVGIATEKLESIFEAFKQADGTTTRNYGGTGLGLSIAQSFASLLEGEISVDSETNKGSTFTLEMPLGKDKKISIEHIVQSASLKVCAAPFDDDRENLSEEKKTFLVIEDDIKCAKTLYDTCREKDYQALVAIDGESGLALIKKYKIDAIILDYMLPGHDGGDILSVLKKDMDTNHIPVYIISVLDSLGDMKSFGALGQMQKPLKEKDILNILQELDNASQRQDARHTENKRSVLEGKKVLVVDDDMRNTYSLSKLLSNKKMKIEIASVENEP